MDIYEKSLEAHLNWQGKLDIQSKVKITNRETLSLAYTPGVAEPCRVIHQNPDAAYLYTMKANTVAVVTDGSAVLGLGNIGPLAALPVMEGKAALFKEFANVNAVPICLDTQDSEEIIAIVKAIAPTFGGINLEDISAPRCFYIEEQLKASLNIPVFHDDQHGTAIVVLAGIVNALKIVKKDKSTLKVVINGAGSAGTAICKLLQLDGFKNIIMVDKLGILEPTETWMNSAQKSLSETTNPEKLRGNLALALHSADLFIGVSAPNIVTTDMIASMNSDAIVFAMANPTPEIMPDLALSAGARIVGTGRSDFPNQVNNVLAFPGIFRGALECRATQITDLMKIKTAYAIASCVNDESLCETNILPKPFDSGIAEIVAQAIKSCN